MRLVLSTLLLAFTVAGCSSPSSESTSSTAAPAITTAAAQKPASTGAAVSTATTTTAASNKAEAPSAPAQIAPGAIRATRCKVANLGTKYRRSLHADSQGNLYAFDDSDAIHKIPPGNGPCGLGSVVDIPQGDNNFVLAPDGSIQAQKAPEDRPECLSLRVSTSGYKGVASNGVAFVVDDKALQSEDLKDPKCSPKKFGDPAPTGNPISITATDKHVYVIDFHGSGHDDNFVLRYDRAGKLVDKVNVGPEGKALARWPDYLTSCGPGVCLLDGEKTLYVFGADGKLARKGDVQGDDFSLGYASVAGMVEIPGKGLFIYVGLPKEKGSSEKVADILRIEKFAK